MRMRAPVLEIAETEAYLELVNLINYYNYPNANKRQVDYGEDADEQAATLARAQTLVLMPVKAKCAVNTKGKPTFKGHEVIKKSDGTWEYGTVPIGVHHEVYIEEAEVKAADGTVHTLPCLFAKQRIWKDNPNVVAAIRRLFEEGKLYTSWELNVLEYEYKGGIKYLRDYYFIGNTYLGYEYATPAFGYNAQVLSVAAEEEDDVTNEADAVELMFANAVAQDVSGKQHEQSEANQVELNENPVAGAENPAENATAQTGQEPIAAMATDDAAAAGVDQTPGASASTPQTGEETLDVSMLTYNDLYKRLSRAMEMASISGMCKYGYLTQMFPVDNLCWYKEYDSEDLDMVEAAYAMENDTLTILSITHVKLVASIRDVAGIIAAKDAEIAQLKPKAEAYDAAEAAKAKAQHEADVASLMETASCTGLFTAEEMTDMASVFEAVDEATVLRKIGEKHVAKATEKKPAPVAIKPATLDFSAMIRTNAPRACAEGDGAINTKASVMDRFLGR